MTPRACAQSERDGGALRRRLRVDRIAAGPAVLLADGRPIAVRCYLAATPWARMIGLLGTVDLAPDEALWIDRCGAVHTLGMRAPVALAFLDPEGRVIRVIESLAPWRVARAAGAVAVVEARAGSLSGLGPGSLLRRAPSPRSAPAPGRRPATP